MSILLAHQPICLGLASLLPDLNGIQTSLESLDSSNPEPEAEKLLESVKDLVDVNTLFDDLVTKERRQPLLVPGSVSASDLVHLQSTLDATASIVDECAAFATAIQASLNDIADERQNARVLTDDGGVRNQTWYTETCHALKLRAQILRALFSAVEFLQDKDDGDSDGNLHRGARSSASTLHYQLSLIEPKLHITDAQITQGVRNAVSTAKSVTFLSPWSTNTNKHFPAVRSVRAYYTGREKQMADLNAAFEDASPGQKRFVIYGLGGSGKTELAFKYAEDHQAKYWGVFFVDGSSRKNATASYLEIATIGGVEPNERAAKTWLMTPDAPWLLIVDNVDDEEVRLDDLLPQGTKGNILITSRNPGLRSYGNVGKRYVELQTMEKEEANELILRAAEEPSPRPLSIQNAATQICQALGYLPLALVHAARAILENICSWGGYLAYYERQTQHIQRQRLYQRSRSSSRNRKGFEEVADNMNVFSSYEILYQSLEASQEERCQDAVELLQVFSYLHYQNIRLETLIRAAINPFKEATYEKTAAQEESAIQDKLSRPKRKTWSQRLREMTFMLQIYTNARPPLPAALRNPDGFTQSVLEDEVHIRLGKALAVLTRRSLVMRQDRVEGLYSMHPLVHKWVRERPNTAVAHQALWCQIAMTTLAKSIPRPPQGDTLSEQGVRRELLPHITHAQKCNDILGERLEENKTLFKPFWPVPKPVFHALHADQAIRFSRVYLECGLFEEALQLQNQTRSFLLDMLGEDHPVTIRVTLFVSGTLWQLARVADATRMQRRAMQICTHSMGEYHPLTLQVADLLGSALFFKGRWSEALRILEDNLIKVTKVYGEDHENTFKSIRNVARLHYRYMGYKKATELHRKAWAGMRDRLGDKHVETLQCLQDLAMSYVRHEAEPDEQATRHELLESHERMRFIVEERKEALGRENAHTLLAESFFAQIKSALGEVHEAEKILLNGLPVAERNFGDHPGVLAAKAASGRLYIQMNRCEDAERILRTLTYKPLYREMSDEDGDHPDRISCIWFLSKSLEKQGRLQDALEAAEDMESCMLKIGGNGLGAKHRFVSKVRQKIAELRAKVEGGAQEVGIIDPDPLTIEQVERLHRLPRSVTA